jgi:hypothetical protein
VRGRSGQVWGLADEHQLTWRSFSWDVGLVPPFDIGPQVSKDDAFTARMRLHQSWYRAAVLQVPCGPGPNMLSTSLYGSMLRREDGERGLTFLTPEIAALALLRQREFPRGIKRHRLLCNLLSSQPMCFNLELVSVP